LLNFGFESIILVMSKLRIGWFFGGRSTEHEVSVITAIQAYQHLDKSKYEVLPVYVSKAGQFYSDPRLLDLKTYQDIDGFLLSLKKLIPGSKNGERGLIKPGLFPKFEKIDLAFPLFHGSFGEDGCIQGLFEIYQIPYVGFNVMGASLSMDKILQKALYQQLGFNIGSFTWFTREDWNKDPKKILKQVQSDLKFPVFVKPATIGSSIGINKASNEDELSFNIEVALTYANKVLIEEAFLNCKEVNCSALGYGTDIKASVCEMPVASSEILSFQDKYQRGGKGSKGQGMASLSRIIPAPISEKLAKQIQEATAKIFKAFDGCGVARIDYFIDEKKEKFWVNEINTPPGSLAFYLWEKSGLSYKELLDQLIELALKRAEDNKKTQYTFESGLLSQMANANGKLSK
jgi:D-alanine-D-alanine ligase